MREEERAAENGSMWRCLRARSSSAHLAIAANSRRHQYGDITPNMRLVIIAISTCGAINSEGIDFISHLAKRTENSIPLWLF